MYMDGWGPAEAFPRAGQRWAVTRAVRTSFVSRPLVSIFPRVCLYFWGDPDPLKMRS